MRTSLKHRVVVGSCLWMCVDVYSETRRNPWKATRMVAQSMILSCRTADEFHSVWPNCVNNGGVIGILGGLLNFVPCVLFMPLISLYSRSSVMGWLCPCSSALNFMADIWALMTLCEWVVDRCVAKRMSVFSDMGNNGSVSILQNVTYVLKYVVYLEEVVVAIDVAIRC